MFGILCMNRNNDFIDIIRIALGHVYLPLKNKTFQEVKTAQNLGSSVFLTEKIKPMQELLISYKISFKTT